MVALVVVVREIRETDYLREHVLEIVLDEGGDHRGEGVGAWSTQVVAVLQAAIVGVFIGRYGVQDHVEGGGIGEASHAVHASPVGWIMTWRSPGDRPPPRGWTVPSDP